jgi:NADH-quinone oxidoreductase subunit C
MAETPQNTEEQVTEAPVKTAAELLTEQYLPNLPEGLVSKIEEAFGRLVLHTSDDKIIELLAFLRDDEKCEFRQLIDIFGVDYLDRAKRFEVIYALLSLKYNIRITVKLQADETSLIPSAATTFSNAEWLEREVFDMYGVRFKNHPDLRRILTDYGFEGHPQRKDFPLTGYKEVRYDEAKQRVVYEPVKLAQEFRNFDYLSPWEGAAKYVLPGDEKAKA